MAEIFNTNLSNVACASISQVNGPVINSSLEQQPNENRYFPFLYSLTQSFKKELIYFIGFESDDGWKEEEMTASKIRNRVTEINFLNAFFLF